MKRDGAEREVEEVLEVSYRRIFITKAIHLLPLVTLVEMGVVVHSQQVITHIPHLAVLEVLAVLQSPVRMRETLGRLEPQGVG